ncbi:PRD domain-containing protein [Evansella clarkii]|uniref:PRD domain-containing protein n=1 Tax=Evansella clarkii TaxID=79879 RepID=UPI00147360FA|nr:PRD domain-containing protein [Evansella clarkii]
MTSREDTRTMQGMFTVEKILNNNVLIAKSNKDEEVVFIGKGIAFGKKTGDQLEEQPYEKVFKLADAEEQEKYKKLVSKEEEKIILIIHEAISKIRDLLGIELHERIHYALTQHLVLAIERTKAHTDIKNPFLTETKWMYYDTFKISEIVIDYIYEKSGVRLPEAEAGFITLHIQSALTDERPLLMDQTEEFISRCVSYIEEKTKRQLDKESTSFHRFVQHLKQMFERSMTNNFPVEKKVLQMLKKESPVCYNLSRNIVRMVEKVVGHTLADAETIYLIIHLQRLTENK